MSTSFRFSSVCILACEKPSKKMATIIVAQKPNQLLYDVSSRSNFIEKPSANWSISLNLLPILFIARFRYPLRLGGRFTPYYLIIFVLLIILVNSLFTLRATGFWGFGVLGF